jgi:putative ABC transport system permease protein
VAGSARGLDSAGHRDAQSLARSVTVFYYYFGLALRSLKRNVVLTVLMIAAIGVGIGASMTTLTIFRAMDGDPIPQKSGRLFVPQIDNWGPRHPVGPTISDNLQDQLSYTDAIAFMNAHAAPRQAAMYQTGLALTPPNPALRPFQVQVRATYTDFFPMFEVPFQYGAPWNAADDAAHARVVVITRELNDKVFAGSNSIGKTLNLDNAQYRVVGVVDQWAPLPRFYDLNGDKYGKSEDAFLPFTRAIEDHMLTWGNFNCNGDVGEGWDGRLHSECVWIQFWAELPTAAGAARYRALLDNYAAEQRRMGRFQWPPHTQLRDLRQWMTYQHVVSDEARILVLVSFSFLTVCLLNAMGLLLAKIMGRAGDIGVRRALGANRRAIFSQCLIETAVVGLAGGLLGLALTALGLLGLRALLSKEIIALSHLDLTDVGIAIALAIVATVIAGLYPTWRALQIQPAWQLKAQ